MLRFLRPLRSVCPYRYLVTLDKLDHRRRLSCVGEVVAVPEAGAQDLLHQRPGIIKRSKWDGRQHSTTHADAPVGAHHRPAEHRRLPGEVIKASGVGGRVKLLQHEEGEA